jgi:hypothetical protein
MYMHTHIDMRCVQKVLKMTAQSSSVLIVGCCLSDLAICPLIMHAILFQVDQKFRLVLKINFVI